MDLLGSLVPSLTSGRRKSHYPVKTSDALVHLIEDFKALQLKKTAESKPAPTASASSTATSAATSTASAGAKTETEKKLEEVQQQMQKRIEEIKVIFYGDDTETDPKPEECQATATLLIEKSIMLTLIQPTLLSFIPFESRKQVTNIFCYLTDTDLNGFGMLHLKNNASTIIKSLSNGLDSPDLFLHCGAMLRACFKYEFLHKEYLNDDMVLLDKFFEKYLIATDSFDIASDAFATFTDILSQHKKMVSVFIEKNYDAFFERYNKLISSGIYIAQRQSLKILSDMLLDSSKAYQEIMLKFIDDKNNLKTIMTVMRVDSAPIQLEAFHVFKLFVANPHKNESIKSILSKNKEKLIPYLEHLFQEKKPAEISQQLEQEKALLIETLKSLESE